MSVVWSQRRAEFAQSVLRVERQNGYFGIHFDLHPNKSDTELGRDVTEENIREFLRRVRPDFVQYDCVGVPGYSGYPTKIGWPAPGIVKDSLAVWRKVTREEGVALLIHYCVLWNLAAVRCVARGQFRRLPFRRLRSAQFHR